MSSKTINARLQLKAGTPSQWASSSGFPLKGEALVYQDNGITRLKVGDGSENSTAATLPFLGEDSGGLLRVSSGIKTSALKYDGSETISVTLHMDRGDGSTYGNSSHFYLPDTKGPHDPAGTTLVTGYCVNGSNYSLANEHGALDLKDFALSSAIPTKISQLENDRGYTTNLGTITKVKLNGTEHSPDADGTVDLGAVSGGGTSEYLHFVTLCGTNGPGAQYDVGGSLSMVIKTSTSDPFTFNDVTSYLNYMGYTYYYPDLYAPCSGTGIDGQGRTVYAYGVSYDANGTLLARGMCTGTKTGGSVYSSYNLYGSSVTDSVVAL